MFRRGGSGLVFIFASVHHMMLCNLPPCTQSGNLILERLQLL